MPLSRLNHIRIVLLQTYHPGNIGAVARAMKTMGLFDLVLVAPKKYPDEEATNRAAGAVDVLEAARVVSSLEEAVADCVQVFGTTARTQRTFSRPLLDCEKAVNWIAANTKDDLYDSKEDNAENNSNKKIAIVFGRERMGLTQADIEQCQQLLYIEGNPEYDVLNMASAVQIVCYELFRQLTSSVLASEKTQAEKDDIVIKHSGSKSDAMVSQDDLQRFYQHLESTLSSTGFINEKHPGDVMAKFRQLFTKADLNAKEVSMLRGVLGSVDWQMKNNKSQ